MFNRSIPLNNITKKPLVWLREIEGNGMEWKQMNFLRILFFMGENGCLALIF